MLWGFCLVRVLEGRFGLVGWCFCWFIYFKRDLNECYNEELITAVIALKIWSSNTGQQDRTGADSTTHSPNQTQLNYNFCSSLRTKLLLTSTLTFTKKSACRGQRYYKKQQAALLPRREKYHKVHSEKNTL